MLLNEARGPFTIIVKMQAEALCECPIGSCYSCFAVAFISENFTNKYPVTQLVDDNFQTIPVCLGFFLDSMLIFALFLFYFILIFKKILWGPGMVV